MKQLLLDWWPVLVTIFAAVGWFVKFLHGLWRRQRDADDDRRRIEARMSAHEDLCGERYRRIEEAHTKSETVNLIRHQENRESLDQIQGAVTSILNHLATPPKQV